MREEVRDIERLQHMLQAVYKLTLGYREKHNEVNWDDIERMRHVLVHGYYKIRPKQLWETIVVDIPALKPVIEQLLFKT